MKAVIRIAIGLGLFAGGLTFLTYGIAQAIENGNCGTDKYGRTVGPQGARERRRARRDRRPRAPPSRGPAAGSG